MLFNPQQNNCPAETSPHITSSPPSIPPGDVTEPARKTRGRTSSVAVPVVPSAIAVMVIVPVVEEDTFAVESLVCTIVTPGLVDPKVNVTFGTGVLSGANACAVKTAVSPATTVSARGVTVTRATEEMTVT